MKIPSRTLQLTIAVFLQFGELDASGIALSYGYRDTPRVSSNLPAGPDAEGPPHETVRYGDTFISLWLDSRNSAKVVKADYADNVDPDINFRSVNDFFVKLITVERWQVVGYLRTNGNLFGVRAPNRRSRPYEIEPKPNRWFIIHRGRAYKVTMDPATERVEDISLVPGNVHRKPENQVGLRTTFRNFGNVHFILFYNDDRGVLGAELNRAYHHPQLHAN